MTLTFMRCWLLVFGGWYVGLADANL